MEKLVEYIEEKVKWLHETFPRQPMTKLTDVLKREHEEAEKCQICLKEFNEPKNKKVRDHCHCIGLYRGAAHNNCNLKYRIPRHIPILFHNLSDYDAHLSIKKGMILGSLQRTRRNTSVLMLKLTSSWLGLSIKMVQKCVKILNLGL